MFAPKIEEALFVVRESGTAFEMHLSISDNPDQTVVICHISKSLSAEARAAQMAVSGPHAIDDARVGGQCLYYLISRGNGEKGSFGINVIQRAARGGRLRRSIALLLAFADWLSRITERILANTSNHPGYSESKTSFLSIATTIASGAYAI